MHYTTLALTSCVVYFHSVDKTILAMQALQVGGRNFWVLQMLLECNSHYSSSPLPYYHGECWMGIAVQQQQDDDVRTADQEGTLEIIKFTPSGRHSRESSSQPPTL